MSKKILLGFLIVLFRCTDLFTTYLSNKNLQLQEQNILVKLLNLNVKSFFILEFILAIFMAFCFYFTYESNLFKIKATSLREYISLFFFKKNVISCIDVLFGLPFKKTVVLIGNIIFPYVLITSFIFSLNNLWVKYVDDNYTENYFGVILYYKLADFYFFDFLIFIFPAILFVFLMFKKITYQYEKYN